MECLLNFVGRWIRVVSSIGCIVVVALSCATPSAPEGGPQDRQAPRLDPKRYSTKNPSTNFKYQRVILTFDEWVRLQSASSQVVMSPPLKVKPSVSVRNRSVVVEWKEPLEDSTTYIINFGDAIQDITEGNKASDRKMVFSTGPYLDSLVCSGQVIDAATRQPSADTWVMLYRNLADSVPKTEKPFYFTKTDPSGNFRIEYIRKGRYQIFAIADKNNDYKYNLPKEPIGFLDTSFVMNDSLQPFLRLLLFEEREKLVVEDIDLIQFGEIRLQLNEAVQSVTEVRLLEAPSDLKLLVEQGADSLHIWMDGSLADTAKLRLVLTNEAEEWQDTIEVSNKKKALLLEDSTALRWFVPNKEAATEATTQRGGGSGGSQPAVSSLRPAQDTTTIPQHPKEALELLFTAPLQTIDTTQFSWAVDTTIVVQEWKYEYGVDTVSGDTLFVDSLQIKVSKDTFLKTTLPIIQQDSSAANTLYFAIDSTEGKRYQLTILPNGVQDFWGRKNGDTLSRVYVINPTDEYGSITSIILGADSSKRYIVEVVNQTKEVVSRRFVQDSSRITFYDYYLPTGPYTIQVSADLNENKRWDVGDYDKKQQPEPRYISKVIQLNAGWENAMELDLQKTPKPAVGKGGKSGEKDELPPNKETLPDDPKDGQTGPSKKQ
ncbi:MAG: Ig-like domain-containing domain [Aureispira sp.]